MDILTVTALNNASIALGKKGKSQDKMNKQILFSSRSKWYQGAVSAGTNLTSTFRVKYEVFADCHSPVFQYGNFCQDDDPVRLTGLNEYTLKCTLEYPENTFYDIIFGRDGTTIVVPVGTKVTSDPIGIEFKKGDTFFIRTCVTVPEGGKFIYNVTTIAANNEGREFGDKTKVTNFGNKASLASLAPLAIYATPTEDSLNFEAIACIGDSIGNGANWDNTTVVDGHIPAELGYMQVAAMKTGRGYITLSMNGSQTGNFSQTSRFRRMDLASHCDVAICGYGTNDFGLGNASFDKVKTNLLNIWRALKMRGLKVYQSTITPWTTSTDSWATPENQIFKNASHTGGPGTPRTLLNDWIRAGGDGVLDGFIDAADVVESSRNSGLWKPGTTTDGIHPNTAAHLLIAEVAKEKIGMSS